MEKVFTDESNETTPPSLQILAKRLPFELQKQNHFPMKMIDELNVMSIGEWNKKYPQFPITRLIEEICPN